MPPGYAALGAMREEPIVFTYRARVCIDDTLDSDAVKACAKRRREIDVVSIGSAGRTETADEPIAHILAGLEAFAANMGADVDVHGTLGNPASIIAIKAREQPNRIFRDTG